MCDRQTLGLQRRAMRSYAQERGWTLVQQIEDVGSGAVGRWGVGATHLLDGPLN